MASKNKYLVFAVIGIAAASGDGTVGAIVSALTQHATLRDLRVGETTLESVFIALTGRDLRE